MPAKNTGMQRASVDTIAALSPRCKEKLLHGNREHDRQRRNKPELSPKEFVRNQPYIRLAATIRHNSPRHDDGVDHPGRAKNSNNYLADNLRFEQHATCPQEHEVRLDVSAFVTGLAKEPARISTASETRITLMATWLMLVVRPVIGGQAGGLHGHVGVGSEAGERRIGTGLSDSFPRTSDEEATRRHRKAPMSLWN